MNNDDLRKKVKLIKYKALDFQWAEVQRLIIELDKEIQETPADIKNEKGGY